MHVVENIDSGGFGRVDKVLLDSGVLVARKTFEPSVPIRNHAHRTKLLNRFKREVRVQSSFQSTAVCPVLDYDLDDAQPWFTMPLADKTLTEEIAECKRRGEVPSQALADLLNALDELHRLGYVHRDLKPQNVLRIDGVWKLTDFGLILPPLGGTMPLTSVGSAYGTLEYAAPEQASEFHTVTAAADIYAFGCILYDIFGKPPRLPFAQHTAPGPIGAIIERCTERRLDRRFVSVSSLRAALITFLSTPPDLQPTPSAEQWVQSIKGGAIQDADVLKDLVRFLQQEAERDDRFAVLTSLDDDGLRQLHAIDESLWSTLADDYCEWVGESAFSYEYCDVLISRLETIFSLGSLGIRAAAALSGAKLATSHNRWFVMGRVLQMCGQQLDDQVAGRICVDIRAFGAEGNFRRCADGISKSYNNYHRLIRDTIRKDDDPASPTESI